MSKMKEITPASLAEITGGEYRGPSEGRERLIRSVVKDNREVEEGSLFIAIKGMRVDGHDFINDAFQRGAACCLVERDTGKTAGPCVIVSSTLKALKDLAEYYRSLFEIPVIGIIGSVGKTTTKEMTAAVLSERFNVLKTDVNLNNEIGVPITLLRLREEHQAAVIEMGISEFGEMERLSKMVRPDICVMTNIGHCHLENLGDLNGVLKAKAEVFKYMKPESLAVMNGDDELLAKYKTGTKKITFGTGKENNWTVNDIKTDGMNSVTCHIQGGGMDFKAEIPAFGVHIVMAALPAAAVGAQLGMNAEEISRGIKRYRPAAGRANVVGTGYITIIDDCYNANPNSVSASVISLCSVPGRHVAILGDMNELGEKSVELHYKIGELCADRGVDLLLCCGEKAEDIYSGMRKTAAEKTRYFPDKASLISELCGLISKGDTVLVKASHSMAFDEITEELKKLS